MVLSAAASEPEPAREPEPEAQAMQTQPAEAPKQVEPASDATRELTEKVASLLRVSVESVIADVTRALARGNRPAEIVDEATSYSSGGAKPKWLRVQGGN